MKIVIAGANSFIGRRLIPNIFKNKDYNDAEVVAVVRDNCDIEAEIKRICKGYLVKSSFNLSALKYKYCDMENYETIGSIVGPGDCFIDLTWMGSRGTDRQNSKMQEFDYECSIAAIHSMLNYGYKIIVTAGSQAEYGINDGIITEETECTPNTEYGRYKLRLFNDASSLCKSKGVRLIEPRYFSLFGPGDYEKTLIMDCMRKMIINEDIYLNACTQFWDYMYVDDAVQALLQLIINDSADGVYNFVTGDYRPLREYILAMKDALDSKSNVTFSEMRDIYKGQIINLRTSAKKLNAAVGCLRKTDFWKAIKETAVSINDKG